MVIHITYPLFREECSNSLFFHSVPVNYFYSDGWTLKLKMRRFFLYYFNFTFGCYICWLVTLYPWMNFRSFLTFSHILPPPLLISSSFEFQSLTCVRLNLFHSRCCFYARLQIVSDDYFLFEWFFSPFSWLLFLYFVELRSLFWLWKWRQFVWLGESLTLDCVTGVNYRKIIFSLELPEKFYFTLNPKTWSIVERMKNSIENRKVKCSVVALFIGGERWWIC